MSKYQIIKGATFRVTYIKESVGYDWETGEEIFEDTCHYSDRPYEEVVSEHENYDDAVKEYKRITDEFIKSNRWPWNDPHYRFDDGACVTSFTDNDDEVWFTLKELA